MTQTGDLIAGEGNPNQLLARIQRLEDQMNTLLQKTSIHVDTLEEVSSDMGVQRAGAFIAGEGDPFEGNLTGAAMMYPPFEVEIDGVTYYLNIFGMEDGVLQFGLSSVNGQAIFCGGLATIGEDGIEINRLGYLIRHTATDGTTERTGNIGMWPKPGGTEPQYGIAFNAPAGTELIVNGNFAYTELLGGSFPSAASNWTETLGDGGSITYDSNSVRISEGLNAKTTYIERTVTTVIGNRYAFDIFVYGGVGYYEFLDASDDSVLYSGTSADLYFVATVTSIKVRLYAGSLASSSSIYRSAFLGDHFSGWTILTNDNDWVMRYSRADCRDRGATLSQSINVSATSPYLLTISSSQPTNDTYHLVKIYWYDGTPTLLQTDTITLLIGTNNSLVTSPSGAVTAKVELVGDIGSYFYTVSFSVVAVSSNLYFDSTGELNLNNLPLLPDNAFIPFNIFKGFLADGTEVAALTDVIISANTMMGLYKVWGGATFPADGAYVIGNVPLCAGTYTFRMSRTRNTGLGKFDLYIDGVKITATPLDFYGTSAYNLEWTIADIVISQSKTHEIKLLANGKNASSSGYGIGGSFILLYKTD